jgi:hypothetical protein
LAHKSKKCQREGKNKTDAAAALIKTLAYLLFMINGDDTCVLI